MAIAAGHDGVDEIAAALGRLFGQCAIGNGQQQHARNADPKHDAPDSGDAVSQADRARAMFSAHQGLRAANLRGANLNV
jgi:hypothetical protein